MEKQKDYAQLITENARLRQTNAWLLLACRANGAIVHLLEKEICRLSKLSNTKISSFFEEGLKRLTKAKGSPIDKDYIFEEITAKVELLLGSEVLNEVCTLWDAYGKETSVKAAISIEKSRDV